MFTTSGGRPITDLTNRPPMYFVIIGLCNKIGFAITSLLISFSLSLCLLKFKFLKVISFFLINSSFEISCEFSIAPRSFSSIPTSKYFMIF